VLQLDTTDPILLTDGSYGSYSIGSNASFQYRKFDGAPGNDYYCNDIPPLQPNVTEVFDATAGVLTLIATSEVPDDDNDGVPTDQERNEDTDGDGIMNILDIDDDGDNVPTSAEGVAIIDGVIDVAASRDTDGDGILDYLDNDDDGDGILTIQEDLNRDLNPANDVAGGSSNYRNNNATTAASPPIASYRLHTYQRNVRIEFEFTDLFLNNDSQEIGLNDFDFGDYVSGAFQVTFTPPFNQ
jgi:hypothetical protein